MQTITTAPDASGPEAKVQEEELAFETSSIVTKRKLVVTKAAGLGVEGLVLGR